MKSSVVIQHDEMDCGAACLAMIGRYYGMRIPLVKYRDLLCFDNNGTTVYDIVQAAKQLNINASPLKGTLEQLVKEVDEKRIQLPCIALIKIESYNHYVVIYKISKKVVKYADPAIGMQVDSFKNFENIYQGVIISLSKGDNFEVIKYNSKSIALLKEMAAKNIKIFVGIFFLSLMVTFLGVSGSLIIEYMVSSAIMDEEVCEEEDCTSHEHDDEDEDSAIHAFNKLFEAIIDSPKIIFYIVLIIYGLRLVVELCKSVIISKTVCNVEEEMSTKYFEKMISLPFAVFKARRSGDFISRFTDVRKLNGFLVNIMTTCILNITFVIGFGIALSVISIKMFCYTVMVSCVFVFFTVSFQSLIRKRSLLVLQNNSQVVSTVEETIKATEVIKTFNLETKRIAVFIENLNKYISALRKFANMCFCHNNIANWISSFGDFLVIYIGIRMCLEGVMGLETVFVYYMLSMYFMSALERLICIQPEISEALVVFRRVEDVLECENDAEYGNCVEISEIEDIELKNVSYKYGLRTIILDNISFKIKKGDKIRLVGENGSGKSTLAHILVGNLKDYQGNIFYNGNKDINTSGLKNMITYVNQDVFLFHGSIANNILMGCEEVSLEKFMQVCKITGVDQIANSYVESYDYVLADNGANLSGGQRQKIALARALLRDTPMYIFDESTSNLDEKSEKEFLNILNAYLTDKTVLIISHDDIFNDFADKTYILEKGRIIPC